MERVIRGCGKRAAFIPFLNAGDPTLEASFELFRGVLAAGADVVEIGLPYSDPLADGPVIQASALRSLRAGFSLPKAFDLTRQLRDVTDKALVLFTYVNPLLQYGPDRFFRDAAAAGADGAIVPDLPFEESGPVRQAADRHGVALIPLVTPTSGRDRIARICEAARGFVYCVSSLGVTGERALLSERVREMVAEARSHTRLPVAVGFGVSTPAQAADIAGYADGVIVGSALIRRLEDALAAVPGATRVLTGASGDAGMPLADQPVAAAEVSRLVTVVAGFARELNDALV
ncbi:MAG: tryptophan synthase subunit alpha [Alicyclobacillaceae bacterium]|nr:tryptophan synthase subunit alpha [Alicyclobacillaceae bacterium]